MADTIEQLYKDENLTDKLYPITKESAVKDINNVTLDTKLSALKCLALTSSSFSSLPQTITNANITSDHVVVNSILSNPSAQTGDWTVTTNNGSLTISGSISGSTTLTLYLIKQRS